MDNPKFQVFKSFANSHYYYRLRAGNGELILNGEGYTSKQNFLNGIQSVKNNCRNDSNYVRKDNPGNYTFNLFANNNEIIGRSENYTSSYAREVGVEAVKKDAPNAPVEDLS